MTTDTQAIRPDSTAARAPADEAVYQDSAAVQDTRPRAPDDRSRGSDQHGPGDERALADAVSRFERALAGEKPGPILDPALLALQAAAAGLASLSQLSGLDAAGLGLTGVETSSSKVDKDPRATIRDLVDLLAASLTAGGAFPPQVAVVMTLPGQAAGSGLQVSMDRIARPVVVRMQIDPDGTGVTLAVTPVAPGLIKDLPGNAGLALQLAVGAQPGQATGGPDQRLTPSAERIDLSWLTSEVPTSADAAESVLTIRVPLPPGIAEKRVTPGPDLLQVAKPDVAVGPGKAVTASGAELSGAVRRDIDDLPSMGQAPQVNLQPVTAQASAAPTAPPAPAVAVWEQVRAVAERMVAGPGPAGVHQIRLEIDPRLMPGVQVAIQMAAGQIQVEFFCANEASRRRLRVAASRDVDQMAERLGRTVHVTIRSGDAMDAHASAEHLHAAR